MSRPFKLYRLQQIDSQLDWHAGRLAEIEKLLADEAGLRAAAAAAEQFTSEHRSAERHLQQIEHEVRQQRIKIEQNESSLYGGKIRNPKELKDLEMEVAALKRFLSVLEDRQLESMLQEEDAAARENAAAEILQKAQQELKSQNEHLVGELQRLKQEQARLQTEREAAASASAEEDLVVYNQLRKSRRGMAVAKVSDRACSACGSTLSAALLNAVHSPNQLNRCEGCGRILYIG